MSNETGGPLAVEDAFYKAFESGDVPGLMALWLPSGPVLCIHPMGPPLTDIESIDASWQQICRAPFDGSIVVDRLQQTSDGDTAVHHVIERFTLPERGVKDAAVYATNTFRRWQNRWYLAAHHASPGVEHETPTSGEPPSPTRH